MKKTFLVLGLLFIFSLNASNNNDTILFEDFSQNTVSSFPNNFKTYPFQRRKAMKVYSVEPAAKNLFLRALDDQDLSVQIFHSFSWNPNEYPILQWKWRPQVLPKGASEKLGGKNDSACGVYVAFGRWSGHAIKYVWSSSLPLGYEVRRKDGDLYMFVKGTGLLKTKQWQDVSVNLKADYKKAFGEEPPRKTTGLGILTDGNATHTPAACDYDDFGISKK